MSNEAGAQAPKLPKMLLRRRLERLRKEADKSFDEAADRLKVSKNTMRRYEAVETRIGASDLKELCAFYGASDEVHAELEQLRESLGRPEWWARYGPRPDSTAGLLELERAATRIRSFDLVAVPGLLQVPGYAKAIIKAVELDISRQQLTKDAELRMERQSRVFGDPEREVTFIIDETALARLPGSTTTKRSQLARLCTPPEGVTVLMLPFSKGPHPALSGFTIFDFDFDEISRAAYTEASAMMKGAVEEDKGVAPYERLWERIMPLTLAPSESTQFIHKMMESISDE